MNLRTPLVLILTLGAFCAAARAEEKWKSLFNGKDLSGWETYLGVPLPVSQVPGAEKDEKGHYTKPLGLNNDPLHVFTVEQVDGRPAIHISGEAYGALTSLDSFSNYHLKLQFKWGQKKFGGQDRPRNAGLMYHGYGKEGEVTGRWLHTQQLNIQEGATGEYVAMGDSAIEIRAKSDDGKRFVYDPKGAPLLFSAKSPQGIRCKTTDFEKPSGEWNTVELICVGGTAIHIVNGQVALRATGASHTTEKGSEPKTGGRLQLQIEASEIYFRDIEISDLKTIPTEWAEK